MSIKFVCRCGKHLRARDEMASRRSRCPRCGAPVGIPSLQPTHRGALLGPMTLADRQRTAQATLAPANCSPEKASSSELTSRDVPPAGRGRQAGPPSRLNWRSRRWVETHWHQCLLLPKGAWPLLLGLACVMTVFSGGLTLYLPALIKDLRALDSWFLWLAWPCLLIPLTILGYSSAFLDGVFASAVSGEVGHVAWPGRNLVLGLHSGVRWLTCFLAGPILPAGLSILYWIHAGDLGLLDKLIVAELNILAIAVWFLLLLSLNYYERLRAVNPVCVLGLIRRLGHRLVGRALFAAVMLLALAWSGSVGLEKIRHDVPQGWLWLFLSWTTGMFFASFVSRWIGVWFYWDRLRGRL
jgi:hypothetical protein